MGDRGRRQDPEMLQTEEASTARTTERQLLSPPSCDENSFQNKDIKNKPEKILRNIEVTEDSYIYNFNPSSNVTTLDSGGTEIFCALTSENKHSHKIVRHVEVKKVKKNPNIYEFTSSPPVTHDSEGNEILLQLPSLFCENEQQSVRHPFPQSRKTNIKTPTEEPSSHLLVAHEQVILQLMRAKNSITDKTLCVNSSFKENWQLVLSYCITKDRELRQYAFAVFIMANGEYWIFPKAYPDGAKHSEEILIEEINQFLLHAGTDVKHILIYTVNSPCLWRNDRKYSCTKKLFKEASKWHSDYRIFTYVAFTKFWGFGPGYCKDLTYDQISETSSVFHSDFQTCVFKLDSKKAANIYGSENKENKNIDNIKKAKDKLMNLVQKLPPTTAKEHLRLRQEIIDSFKLEKEIGEKLLDKWPKLVENSALKHMKQKVTEYVNSHTSAFLYTAIKDILGENCYLQFMIYPHPSSKDKPSSTQPNRSRQMVAQTEPGSAGGFSSVRGSFFLSTVAMCLLIRDLLGF